MTSPRYADALAWTAELHSGQRRKGSGAPYLSHLLAVSVLVWRDGGDEDEAIAALLHDAVEDQGGLPVLEEIRARYGGRVAALVEACTDSAEEPKPPWGPRKQAHFEALRTVEDLGALRVVAADKLDNALGVVDDLEVIGPKVWQIFSAGRDGTLWYYTQMHGVLCDRIPDSRLVHRLGAAVDQMRRLALAGG